MARMPSAEWQGERSPRKPISRYDIVCIHTIVGKAPAHAAHFSTTATGKIIQSRDTEFRSGANLNGNPRIIAIENEDRGSAFGPWNTKDGHAVPAFTDEQINAIAQICAWAHETHGVPLVACPDSKPDSRGIAYHRQGIDGNWADYEFDGRVRGGEVWTKSRGKVCPGDRRIRQIPAIIARAKQIAGGAAAALPMEDDMPYTDWPQEDREALTADVARAVHGRSVQVGGDTEPLGLAVGRTRAGLRRFEATQIDPAQVAAAVVAALPGSSLDVTAVAEAFRKVMREGVG
jgi:hypothetical protein